MVPVTALRAGRAIDRQRTANWLSRFAPDWLAEFELIALNNLVRCRKPISESGTRPAVAAFDRGRKDLLALLA